MKPKGNKVNNTLKNSLQNLLFSPKVWSTVLLFILVIFVWKQCKTTSDGPTLEEQSALIEKQIKNVSKLVVTEGTFSQVYSYKDQKKYFLDILKFEKKALMVVNSEVFIQYNLKDLAYEINEKEKLVLLKKLPKEEIKVLPKIQFYDINESVFNPFGVNDYNKIAGKVQTDIEQKLQNSSMVKNAQNRLVAELSGLLVLSNTLGWRIQYDGEIITTEQDLQNKFKG
jgi:hypothetical protein